MIPMRDYRDDEFLFMATKKGLVKKTKLSEYANIRKTGWLPSTSGKDDQLIEVKEDRQS